MQRLSVQMRDYMVCNSAVRFDASQCPSAPLEFSFDGDYDSFVVAVAAARTACREAKREVGVVQVLSTLTRTAVYDGLHLENGDVLIKLGSRPIVRVRAVTAAATVICIDMLDVWSRCGTPPSGPRRMSDRERQRRMQACLNLAAMLTSFTVSGVLLLLLTHFNLAYLH